MVCCFRFYFFVENQCNVIEFKHRSLPTGSCCAGNMKGPILCLHGLPLRSGCWKGWFWGMLRASLMHPGQDTPTPVLAGVPLLERSGHRNLQLRLQIALSLRGKLTKGWPPNTGRWQWVTTVYVGVQFQLISVDQRVANCSFHWAYLHGYTMLYPQV